MNQSLLLCRSNQLSFYTLLKKLHPSTQILPKKIRSNPRAILSHFFTIKVNRTVPMPLMRAIFINSLSLFLHLFINPKTLMVSIPTQNLGEMGVGRGAGRHRDVRLAGKEERMAASIKLRGIRRTSTVSDIRGAYDRTRGRQQDARLEQPPEQALFPDKFLARFGRRRWLSSRSGGSTSSSCEWVRLVEEARSGSREGRGQAA